MAFSPTGTLGGFFVGFTISLFLHGVLIAQVSTFYRHHGIRPYAVAALAAFPRKVAATQKQFVSLLENAHTVFMSIGAWDYIVDLHSNISKFYSPVIALGVLIYISATCNTLCRSAFAYSIYKLNGHRGLFPAIIIVLTLLVMAVSITYATAGVQQRPWGEEALAICFYLGTAAAIATDILITASMFLLFARRSAGFRMHVLPNVPVDLICVIGVLVSYVVSPTSFIWLSFYLILGKVYTNSLLGFLNARQVIFVGGGASGRNMLQTTMGPQFTSVVTVDRADTPDSQFYLDAAEDDPREPAPGR
ncbi:hypothetical protein LXA43DRAFT_1058559 [Ganoderma leucocontextum]|nr:hypothetical protein LXA43DRAFT_1058559 [Ganoderma leucocontextum]